MSKKNLVTYNKPDPPFLRKIREQIGYKESPDIDTKKQELIRTDEDLEDQDDEKPTVVIMEKSNLTKEEQEDFAEKLTEVKAPKIMFKKPVKKDEAQKDNFLKKNQQHTLKRSLDDDKKKENAPKENKKIKQKEKNSRLLSFDEEEEF